MSKDNLKLNPREIDLVLSSLGYINGSRSAKQWAGQAKCHGGKKDYKFSFHYEKGVAQCWSNRCFGAGTDIYGVVEHETGCNFREAIEYVQDVIGRDLDNEFDSQRSKGYYENLMAHINQLNEQIEQENKKTRWISDKMWKTYASEYHPYWAERGFSKETLEYFGAGYNRENNRITIPIFDLRPDGSSSIVAIKQRIASDDNSLINDENPKYLHDSYEAGKVLFNLNNVVDLISSNSFSRFLTFKGIILVEGNLDVMMGHQLGQPNIIGTGSNYLTKDQARLLERYTDQLLIIPDEDEKWNEEKQKMEWHGGKLIASARDLLGSTMTLYVSRVRPNKDVGSLCGPYGAELLAEIVRGASRLR